MQSWRELPLDGLTPSAKKSAIRLNALGSLFYFSTVCLGYTRLTRELHGHFLCKELERDRIRLVMEFPRDHFKTTCATISASMWWALPFTETDEKLMRSLGYGDEWIRWMKRAHNTCTRTLISSETGPNVKKMGDKIEQHYLSNATFQWLFPEIQPTGKERWNQDSLIHRRLNDGTYQSEGTYDFISAQAALQSNHYERIIEDDLVGEDAVKSDSVMQGTINWHQKLPGAFDSVPGDPDALGDQIVIGNRWSHRDLNSWIRENERETYKILTHSAEGGCCDLHAPHTPIFPQEFSMNKLAMIRRTQGDYIYSCHFLNDPVAPEAVRFKSDWLRVYDRSAWEEGKISPRNTANYSQLSTDMRGMYMEDLDNTIGAEPRRLKMAMHHEVRDGEIVDDIPARDLDRVLLLDPNHSGEFGRTRNAILVLGIHWMQGKPRRIYFLDAWAKASSHEEWIDAAIGENTSQLGLAFKWKVHRIYVEEVAGQAGWKFYFKERMRHRGITRQVTVLPLKIERSENAKTNRIVNMEAVYSNGLFWMPRSGPGRDLFMDEYTRYPNGATLDLLDLAGYSPQCYGSGSLAGARDATQRSANEWLKTAQSLGQAGY